MAIFLEDLNATATKNALSAVRELYLKSDEWKHTTKSAKLVADKCVALINDGKLYPAERTSAEEIERLCALDPLDVPPANYRVVSDMLFNKVTLDTQITSELISTEITEYWEGVIEEAYYLEEFANDVCAEFDSVGNIVSHTLEIS